MDQATDSSLIELAKGGEQAAFAELYSRISIRSTTLSRG